MASKIHTPSQHILFKSLDLGTITSSNGASQDCLGYEEVMFDFTATTQSASTWDSKLQESPDNSTWVDVPGATIAQIPASQTKLTRVVDVKASNRQRYLRWVHTVTGTVVGSVTAHLVMPEAYPVTQDNSVLRV